MFLNKFILSLATQIFTVKKTKTYSIHIIPILWVYSFLENLRPTQVLSHVFGSKYS